MSGKLLHCPLDISAAPYGLVKLVIAGVIAVLVRPALQKPICLIPVLHKLFGDKQLFRLLRGKIPVFVGVLDFVLVPRVVALHLEARGHCANDVVPGGDKLSCGRCHRQAGDAGCRVQDIIDNVILGVARLALSEGLEAPPCFFKGF